MVNTVILSTLERRQQIGILQAIGLSRRRMIGILLIENGIIALLGTFIGLGLSSLNSTLITTFGTSGGGTIPLPSNAVPLTFFLIFTAVAFAWIATYISTRFIVYQSVTDVLRYD